MSSPSHGFVIFANHMNDPIVESLDAGTKFLQEESRTLPHSMTVVSHFLPLDLTPLQDIEDWPWICAIAER